LLGLLALGPAAQADPGDGDIGIQLLQGPAGREQDSRAHLYIVDHLAPGTTIKRDVRVVNKSPDRHRIDVYPAAATVDEEKFVFAVDRTANELTSWVTLDAGRLDLAPRDDAVVKATIVVPATATAGEHYGVIWASVASAPSPSGGIQRVNRVGVRLYLDIGPGGEPRSDFRTGDLTATRSESGDPSLTVRVTNTGGRALDMTGSVDLSAGPAGQRAGPFPVTGTATLSPGQAGTVVVQLPRDLPNGPWTAELALKSGLVSHSLTGQVTFPEPGGAGVPGVVMTRLSSPWTIAGGSLTVGLLTLAGLIVAARRARNYRGPGSHRL